MNYSPTNYNDNYYSFPAYRAVVGSQTTGSMPNPIDSQGYPPYTPQAAYRQVSTPPGVQSGTLIQGVQGTQPTQPAPSTPGLLPLEQSFIENILRLNLGKVGTFYMTYENNTQWNAKIIKGIIEAAGRDHIIISDIKTGMRYLLLMVNLDYVTFDEQLNYTSPYQQGSRR